MGYSDAKYNTRDFVLLGENLTSTATATASAQVSTTTGVTGLPTLKRRTVFTGGYALVRTAPASNCTSAKVIVLNGTDTLGSFAISTNTAGQTVAITLSSGTDVSAGTQPTVNIVSTATASATASQGNYDLYFETNEGFA